MSESNYLLNLLHQASEEKCGQDAIEHALIRGALKLTYNLETDLHTIFDMRSNCCDAPEAKGQDGICGHCRQPAILEANYDKFIVAWQRATNDHGDALTDLYHASGLMEEILRPIPLSEMPQHNLVEV